MGKHNLKKNTTVRSSAVVAAVGVGAAVLSPAAASAATVTHKPSGVTFNVPDNAMPTIKPYMKQAGLVEAKQALAKSQAKVPSAVKVAKKAAPKKSTNVGHQIAAIAKSKIGSPYSWGAAGPNAFDCSGLTSWAYKQVGKQIPRTSDAQANTGRPVSLKNLQPGDIVSYYSGASHVAIYIGNGKVVQALNSGSPVQINDLHMMPVYNAVRF
ncbi:C40 family peptidase [Corynebacterium auriscanis]|uniref:C40 family peptidase n=1 Tax=Corynebacterium auriscanis TaxID=99807 RepID=UPI0025B38C5A|nr:NlpC/P60 family protein [Corynebacterium auriscanis]WJY72452.1 putative endopeptidase precursor [Corynebacterium auriscanis]